MTFNAWAMAGVGGGALALNYVAAGRKIAGSDTTSMRLSLTKDNSLVSDVRVIGGGLALIASMYAKGATREALQVIAAASGLSVLTTEALRWQLGRSGARVAGDLPVFPSFGALGNNGRSRSFAPASGSWAAR